MTIVLSIIGIAFFAMYLMRRRTRLRVEE